MMNQRLKILLIIVLLASAAISCKKNAQVLTANATIINSGSPAYDGCGWLIKLSSDNIEYSPTNLAASFQKDSLKVSISYTLLTTKYRCGRGAGIQQVKIDAIRQAN